MEIIINGQKGEIATPSLVQMCTDICDKILKKNEIDNTFDYFTYNDALILLKCANCTSVYKDYLIKGAETSATKPEYINIMIKNFIRGTEGDLSLFDDILTETNSEVDLSEKFYNYYTVRDAIEDYLMGEKIAGYITADDVSKTLDDFDKWCKTAEDGEEYFLDGIPYTIWEEDPELEKDE